MTYKELALIAIGMQTEVPDRIAEKFKIDDDMTQTEMEELIGKVVESDFKTQLQNLISANLYEKVIENATKTLGADSRKFKFWCNSIDTDLYYNGSHVSDWEELKLKVWREKAERKKQEEEGGRQ